MATSTREEKEKKKTDEGEREKLTANLTQIRRKERKNTSQGQGVR